MMFYYSAAILPSILHSRGEGESYIPPKKTIISFNDGTSTQLYLTDGTQEGTQIVNTSSTYTD